MTTEQTRLPSNAVRSVGWVLYTPSGQLKVPSPMVQQVANLCTMVRFGVTGVAKVLGELPSWLSPCNMADGNLEDPAIVRSRLKLAGELKLRTLIQKGVRSQDIGYNHTTGRRP